jgi:hypothetical protein
LSEGLRGEFFEVLGRNHVRRCTPVTCYLTAATIQSCFGKVFL